MFYIILRAVYGLYFAIAILILIITLSRALFSKTEPKVLLQSILLAVIWPVSLFSKGGRSVLRNTLTIKR